MKVKKIFFMIMIVFPLCLAAEMIHHTMISITEQKLFGHMFKHVITSSSCDKDEFFIDGYPVSKENYYKEFERMHKKEWEEALLQQEVQRRSRFEFAESVQMEVHVKLLDKVIVQITDILQKILNPSLEKFFVFTDVTIDSADQLYQLKAFIDQVQISIKKRIEAHDIESLHMLYKKLEMWPQRLQNFFQDTVKQAIAQSDDTAILKDLLTFACDSLH